MKVSIIVAVDKKRGIGKDGKMPWNIPEDLKMFRQVTMGHPVIMGRKTFESMGKRLPGRTNIVISKDPNLKITDCKIATSLEDAIEIAREALGSTEAFVIGGGQIFSQAINIVDKIYLTLVEGEYQVDTFFPPYSSFNKITLKGEGESNGYKYKFLELEK